MRVKIWRDEQAALQDCSEIVNRCRQQLFLEIMPKKWKGLCNYILPSPSVKEYELMLYDEDDVTYMWYKNENEYNTGFKSWTWLKIATWLHKWFGWYV